MTGAFPGRFLDGVTAIPREVIVTVEGDAVVARQLAGVGAAADAAAIGVAEAASVAEATGAGDQVLRWPRARIARAPIDRARVALSCDDFEDASLEVFAAAAEELLGPGARGRRRDPRRPRWAVLAAYAAGCALVATALYFAATPLARAIARRVPRSLEAQLGQGLATLLVQRTCETAGARAGLGKLARALGADPDLVIHVLDAPMVNAFTFPGGTVIVTRGLLNEAEGPDEVAGVLAHELEHVARRHVMVHVVRSSLLTALWQASVGDYAGFMVVDPKTALDIATLRFSRDDEREADRGGLQRLDAAGIPRDGLRRFFDRMRDKTDAVPAWLSNHPASAERAAAIVAGHAGARPASTPLTPAEWQAVHDGCQSPTPTSAPGSKSPPANTGH